MLILDSFGERRRDTQMVKDTLLFSERQKDIAQLKAEIDSLRVPLAPPWQMIEGLQRLFIAHHRLPVGRMRHRALTRLLPVGNGLFVKTRLGIVMCQQFGLRLGRLGKLGRQYLRNALVILLAGALE
jgi:hypothetical protein